VLLGLGVTSFVLFLQAKAVSTPEAIAARYLTLVERGDIEAAMRMEDRAVGKDDVLLTDAAYAQATGRLSGFRVERVRRVDADHASVEAQTQAGGRTGTVSFSLERRGWTPGELVGVTAWRLRPVALGTVAVQIGAPESVTATIVGKPLAHPTELHQLTAFPGRYPVAVTVESGWFTVQDATATVSGFDERAEAKPVAELTDKGRAAAIAAADGWLQNCLGGGAQPAGCSFQLDSGAPADEVWTNERWTLTTPPAIAVSAWTFSCGAPDVVGGCWPVATTSSGRVEFSADYSKPSTGEEGTITTTSPVDANVEGAIVGFGGEAADFTSITWR
jgi:hypothetical protein